MAPGEEELSIGDILKEAGVNIATNAGFNTLGELAPATLRALSSRFHGRPVMSAAQDAALEKAIHGAELTADEQRMVTRLKEAYPEYVMQRGYTPLEAEEPVILDNVVRQEKAAGNAANELVQAYREGTLTNAQIETLKPGGANRAAFEQATGMKLPETSSETRRMLREGLDNGQKVAYSETMNSTGGAQGEFTGTERVTSISQHAEPGRFGSGESNANFGNQSGRTEVLYRTLSNNSPAQEAIAKSGATQLELRNTTSEPQLFSSALEQARQSNPHGLMVSGKSVEELTQPGTVTFMSSDGLAGALVTADGDIEAVFKNPQSNAKKAVTPLLLEAINNGGTKLDCYGAGLVAKYSEYGFEPVAKVPWNPEYAPNGWTYGPQDVFVMKLADGLNIDEIIRRLNLTEAEGGFHKWTKADLDALPVLDYDAALAYRDELIEIGKTDVALQMPRAQASAAQAAIPSVMDDASISVSAPVSDLTRGRAVRSAGEPNIPAGMRERGFAESLRTKSDLPDEVKAEFVDTPEVYRQLSNAETIAKADAAWGNGLEEAQRSFRSMLETKDPAAIPLGKNIADELIRQGRSEDAAQLLRDMSAALTSSGQFSQAAAIALMKEDPMTALSYLQKQIDKMNAEGTKKFGEKWKDFTLTDEEIKAFGDVPKGDEEALKNIYESVGKRVAKEYPTTMKEKMVELSHIAMLLNPRTQVRNVLSNIAMMPATFTSDKVSALGQKVYSKINPDFKPELALTASKESKDLAAQVYDSIKGSIDNTASKWENSAMQGIREKEMFKGMNGHTAGDIPVLEDVGSRVKGGLNTISQKLTGDSVFDALSSEKSVAENVRQLTYGLLELGDKGFVAQRFKSYLSKAIEASGAKTLDAVPASAIDRAVQEAMKATFKDDNAMTRLVSSIKKNTGFFGETLLPFTKTPANVTMRALDYSPAGIYSAVKMAKSGAEAAAVIDQVAKATTGTLAILLGIGLYNKGIITGPEDEDEDKAAFQKQQGWLPYAVKFGDNYYTYDWAQPGSMGLVLGSTIMSQLDKDGSIETKDLVNIIKSSVSAFGDTLLQQSTLQNLLDVFSGYGSTTENLINEVLETPQRLIPSLAGATARVADTTQRSTYSKGDFFKTQIDTLKSKIPGLSQTLPATYDTWGNEVQRSGNSLEAAFAQYLNPGQLGYSGGQTPLDEEIMRLYGATNDSGVFPHKADRTVTVAGEKIDLDNQQYSEFQRLLGQASYDAANAFLEMPGYDSLADEQKADALQGAYAAAKDVALSEMFEDYTVPESRENYADMYEEFGPDGLALWAYYKQIENWDGEGGVKNADRKNAIDSLPGLTRAQRSFMWFLSGGKEPSNPYD